MDLSATMSIAAAWTRVSNRAGPDAADALGLAITHAHAGAAMARIAKAQGIGAGAGYKSGRSH